MKTEAIIYSLLLATCALVSSSHAAAQPLLETHSSLQTTPAGAAELLTGDYQSVMRDAPCPFRVFTPVEPRWPTLKGEDRIACEGMRLAVYVLNLQGVPRPSTATDRSVIEDLIARSFLVVTVDFGGSQIKDHLEFQKDINGLFCAFGGEWHSQQSYFTANRKKLLEYPGPKAMSHTSFPYVRNGRRIDIPVNRAAIYVLPSGYTVEPHRVIKGVLSSEAWRGSPRDTLFLDIVYPKSAPGNQAVPLLLEGSSTGSGEFVVNANTPILYSWLFNGYAFASLCYVKPDNRTFTQTDALDYLQSQQARYSLSGKVGSAGISKSCARCYSESNAEGKQIAVCMPAVGGYPSAIWKNLNKDATPLVLSWCHLNGKGKDRGDAHRTIQSAYAKADIADKCLYFSSPLAGHEYDLYHLNKIILFFDKYCK